jgi:hypothetical protein
MAIQAGSKDGQQSADISVQHLLSELLFEKKWVPAVGLAWTHQTTPPRRLLHTKTSLSGLPRERHLLLPCQAQVQAHAAWGLH